MSFTAVPASGAKLRSSVLSLLIAERTILVARKTADETVNNSATLQDDNELTVPVEANAVYQVVLDAIQSSGATPGFKCNFTYPSGASPVNGFFDCGSSAANEQFGLFTASVSGITGAAANSKVFLRLVIIVGSTAGNVTFQWAQQTANASDTIVRSGSTLTLVRLD